MRVLWIAIAIVLLAVLGGLFVGNLLTRSGAPKDHTLPIVTETPPVPTRIPTKPPPEDVIKNYISKIDPEIRSVAVSILYSYLEKSYVVVEERVYVSARSSELFAFMYYYPFIYELTVSVSGNCIGTCDIDLELLDQSFRVVEFMGRVSYVRRNLTMLQALGMFSTDHAGIYYLRLDNSYSIFTSKTVHITIRAYVPADEVMNDKAYKIMAIALWVSANINYVSDPHGFEYIASPRETLKIRAGDCDDFAVLLTSLYRSVGLRSAVGLVDTNGDTRVDHATALVALERYEVENFKKSLEKYSVIFGRSLEPRLSLFNVRGLVWLIIDPLVGLRSEPWYVPHEPYYLIKIIE